MKQIPLPLIILFCVILSCDNRQKDGGDNELAELHKLMQGSFNSERQAKADSSYYNISLEMHPIWEQKGHYLYVEQALNSMLDNPYRQRIYQLSRINDSLFKSVTYILPNDSLWIGKWANTKYFDTLKPEDLTLRDGCDVFLERLTTNHYKGATGNKTCRNSMLGASYASSEVEIMTGKVISWDRGFDAQDNHVWGAEKAGYIFEKLK
jgi:hypothetical protein